VQQRLPALTGIRFVAASMIFLFHFFPQDKVPSVNLGQGVSLFFLLSGFILTYVYRGLEYPTDIRSFFVARFARLWPAHLCTLLLVLCVGGIRSWDALLLNVALLQAWIPIERLYFSYNAVTWSISTEVFFYCAFPFLVRSFERTWYFKLGASFLILCGIFFACDRSSLPQFAFNEPSIHGLVYISPVSRIFEFIVGMCCCLLWRTLQDRHHALGPMTFTILEMIAVATTGILLVYPFPWLHYYIGDTGTLWIVRTSAVPGFFLILLVFAFERGLISRLMGTRVFVFLGEISFAVYLVHLFVIDLFRQYFDPASNAVLLGLVVTVAATLVSAMALHFGVEVPGRVWIRFLLQYRQPTMQADQLSDTRSDAQPSRNSIR
jgi:peptidoglycan/LPS O-acetylase OafA/YrhL